MNINAPKISRRSFIITSAAVGGGLAIGINPFSGTAVVRAADGSPEIGAWVVIRPDDTVVVRIARSEMGQGSLTGLAQMVAEELECNWNKVTWEYPTPGTNVARKRIWGDYGTGGSRGIRTSQDYVRKGGAAARIMLVQAAAEEWKVPASECAVSLRRHHAQGLGPQNDLRQGGRGGGEARSAEGRAAEGPEGLEDHRQAAQAAGHGGQAQRQAGLRRRPQAARHAERGDQGFPGVRRQGEELRFGQGRKHARREEGRARARQRGRGGRRHLVARQDRARCRQDRLGQRPDGEGFQRRHRHDAEGGPGRRAVVRPQQDGRRQGSRSPARRRRSRPSTPIRTRTTPAWSR